VGGRVKPGCDVNLFGAIGISIPDLYLVDDSKGYTEIRSFHTGSGYHSWTLYAAQIPLVPLVP